MLKIAAAATEKLICGWRVALDTPVSSLEAGRSDREVDLRVARLASRRGRRHGRAAATEKLICGWRYGVYGDLDI